MVKKLRTGSWGSETTRRRQAKKGKRVKSVPEFMQWVTSLPPGKAYYFRGLQDANYHLHSALYRRIQEHYSIGDKRTLPADGTNPQPSVSRQADKDALINRLENLQDLAKARNYNREANGRTMHDLELIGTLQHHGAATPLMDFSTNPLLALWFACLSPSNKTGMVWAVETSLSNEPDDGVITRLGNLEKVETTADLLTGKDGLHSWESRYINQRSFAQNSVFLLSWPELEERADIDGIIHCCRILKKSKGNILDSLDSIHINAPHVFDDLSGYARENAHDKPYMRNDKERAISNAMPYYKNADYKKALQLIEAVPDGDDDYMILDFKASLKQEIGETEEAIECYKKAISLNRHSSVTYFKLAFLQAKLGENQNAIKSYGQAISLNPSDSSAYNNRANSHLALGNNPKAMADFNKAIELDPSNSIAYYNRGNLKVQPDNNQEAMQEAMEDFDKAIELDPYVSAAYNNRGRLNAQLGNNQKALEDFDQAAELDPNLGSAYYNRGILNTRLKHPQKAMADFDKTIELEPDFSNAYRDRGLLNTLLRNHPEAMADFDKTIELNPNDSTAYNTRGHLNAQLGNNPEAMADFDKAIALNPNSDLAYYYRGFLHAQLNDNQEAMADFNKAIELDPNNSGVYNNRGNIHTELGNNQEAMKDFDKAIELDPNDAAAYSNRGNLNALLDKTQEAMADFDKAIELDQNYAAAYYNRAQLKEEMGDHAGAQGDQKTAELLGHNAED